MKRDKHLTHGFGQRSHKYIARVPNGRGYRYFYDANEYRAYQQGKSGGNTRSVWNTLGTVGSVTGNQGLITFANTMNLLQNNHNKPANIEPHRSDRPHSRKVKIGRGTVKVKKGNRLGDYGVTIGSGGVHVNMHKPKPINSLDPSVKDYMKSTNDKRKAEEKAREKAFKKEQEKKRREEEESQRKRDERREASNRRYKKGANAVRNAVHKLRKIRKRIRKGVLFTRPGGGGGSF